MSEPEQKSTTQDLSLSEDLLQFYQEFAAFNDFYASFCATLADVVVEDQVMDAGTVEGVNRCARWLKYRMEEFKGRLEAIVRKSRTESHE